MQTRHHQIPNGDGWSLSLHQTWDEDRLVPGRDPVLIVPGYGMNSFIFSYHPSGISLEGFLAEAGFETWRADLRAQGGSLRTGGSGASDDFGLGELAVDDLGAVIDGVLAHTRTGGERVDVIGASLGGSLIFAHLVLQPAHRIGKVVAMGSPVRWVEIHPLLRALASSPWLVGLVRFRGTRKLAEHALPLLARHTPWVLSIYMNTSITDVSAASEMVKTVEDPNRRVNRQIAHWVRKRDLEVRGVNIAESLGQVQAPLLCVLASGDGIVPRATAVFPHDAVSSTRKAILEVGDRDVRLAHADLFISREAHRRVFDPVARWLAGEELP